MFVKPRSSEAASPRSERPWWNRPLIGDKSLVDRVKAIFLRQDIIEDSLELHDSIFKEISRLSRRMVSLDQDKFGNKEFLAFVRFNRSLQRGEGVYHQLLGPTELLKAGLTAHHSFTSLEQIEFAHRGRTFSDMYSFVDSLCANRVHSEVFCRQVTGKSPEIFAKLKSPEGKEALRRYALHLEKIGQHQLSLNLLYAFKRLQFRSYDIFRVVADILKELKRSDLLNLDVLRAQVLREYESFEKLGDLIGLKAEQQTVQTYTLLFQYLAMDNRHARSYEQFIGLSAQLKNWKELANKLIQIRKQYPITEFRQPKQFRAKVPGNQLYDKYSAYFDDL